MRIRMQLPQVEPDVYEMPAICPDERCQGEQFKLHQGRCQRAIVDPDHEQVTVRRYRCWRCRRTFRV